jgi:uncharacterized membrane protein
MPFNLLLFPLVGGYFFLTFCNKTRYYHQRIDHQRLLFNSIFVGIFSLTSSYFLLQAIELINPGFLNHLKDFLPLEIEYLEVAVFSFLLSILSALIVNLVTNKTKELAKSIDKIGNDLEKIIKKGFTEGELISLTLKSGKVYVGIPLAIPEPSKSSSYISMIPFFSGYRNNEKELKFTTEYLTVHENMDNRDKYFSLIITTSEIISANLFDLNIYQTFNKATKQSPV